MNVIPAMLLSMLLAVSVPVLSQAAAEESGNSPATTEKATTEGLDSSHSLEQLQLLIAPLTLAQLEGEAETWQGYVQDSMSLVARLKVDALDYSGPDLDALHHRINQLSAERSALVDKFELIIDSMELKGADPELVSGYRQYLSGALASELQATDVRTMLSMIGDWIVARDGGIGFMISAATIIGALFILVLVSRFVRSLVRRAIGKVSHFSQLMQEFLLKATYWLAFGIGLMVVLSLFGVNVTPLFAVLGGASFILAFAMQETLGNLAAGLMIMINKPFDVGDLVDTNGVIGEVEAVSIVSTTVRTLDNQVVILPNSQVWGSIITNVTVSPVRRVDMVFGIGYGDDIDTAEKVLNGLVENHPLILDDPEPNIAVHELADSSVNFICRPWVKTEDYWTVYWDLTRRAKESFDAAGVSIPFPQRDVHLYQQG